MSPDPARIHLIGLAWRRDGSMWLFPPRSGSTPFSLGMVIDPKRGQYGRKCTLNIKPSDIQIRTPSHQQEEFIRDVDPHEQKQIVAHKLQCTFEMPKLVGFSTHYDTYDCFELYHSEDSQVYKTQHITARVSVCPHVPALSQEMLDIICQLPTWSDTDNRSKEQYYNFFVGYGTHVVLCLSLEGNLRIMVQTTKAVGIDHRAHENIQIFGDGGNVTIGGELTSILKYHFKEQPGYPTPSTFSWPGADIHLNWIKALKDDPIFFPDNEATEYRWIYTLDGLTLTQKDSLRQASEHYLKSSGLRNFVSS
ncbi:hypothetical protein C8R45DRAFT_943186 [Mycena sanguinolenta]|nr:hypothetical protein C8R45DRAFT_943186 [Mycena sanguinolenta]